MKPRHDKAQAFLATLAENCPELPFEPTLLPELFASTADSSTKSMTHIANLAEKSQGLATRILRVANSAYYGIHTAVSSLTHAVRFLGLNEIRNIILQLGVTSVMRQLKFPKGFNFEELWEHQLRTANMAREIALALPEANLGRAASPDDIYAAGLLHDLGKTMLAVNCPDDWLAIWDLASCEQLPFYKAEDDYWGVDHAVAGARLLTYWGLPANLTELVNWHHAPKLASPEYSVAAHIVAVANLLARLPEDTIAAAAKGTENALPDPIPAWLPEGLEDIPALMEKLMVCCTPERAQSMAEALSE